MSYSRWNKYSVWYTFWDAGSSESTEFKLPTKRLRDNQYFEICDFDEPIHISYKMLKEIGIKGVVKKVQETYKDRTNIKFSDYSKLRWQLIEFMTDVDEHFQWINFFKYEWWYPVRNEVRWFFKKFKK